MRFTCALLCAAAQLCARPPVAGKVSDGPTLRYIDIKTGDGAPAAPGKQYTVHYSGWLRDGTGFDASIGKDPFQLVQGRRQVIAGGVLDFVNTHVAEHLGQAIAYARMNAIVPLWSAR